MLCARSGPTLAAGQITETALHFLLENIFRNARVLAHHASQVLNNILNVLDNLGLKAMKKKSLFSSSLVRWLLNASTLSLWKAPLCSLLIKSFCVFCLHARIRSCRLAGEKNNDLPFGHEPVRACMWVCD